MKRMKKAAVGLIMMIGCIGLTGCTNYKDIIELAECYDEEVLEAEAKEAITVGESGDYEGLIAKFDETLAETMTEENYQEYLTLVGEKGAFKEFGKVSFAGRHVDETDSDYAAVAVTVKYEDGKMDYVIGYNEDLEIIQYSMK